MSSISKINSFEKVNMAELKANQVNTNPIAVQGNYGYDSFTPSFKGAKVSADLPEKLEKGLMARLGDKFNKGLFRKALTIFMGAAVLAGTAVTQTSCQKVEVNVDMSALINAFLAYMEVLKAQNDQIIANQEHTNELLEQNNKLLQYHINLQIAQGHTLDEILAQLQQNGLYLEDLVEGNEDLMAIMREIRDLVKENNSLTAEGNQLLAKIIGITLDIYNMTSLNNDELTEITSMLHNLIQHVSGMSHMLLNYYNTIIALLQGLDAHLLSMGADIINQMLVMDEHQQENFAQAMTMMQNIQDENQAMFLQLMARLASMQQAQQNQYLGLMAFLQGMQQQFHGDYLAMLDMLAQIQAGNEAGVNAILAAIQNMGAGMAAQFAQLWEHLDQIEANQVTQIQQIANLYVSIENGNATLDQILQAIQDLQFVNPEVNLDVIEGLLQQIYDRLDILGDINNNAQAAAQATQLIATTVNQIKAQIAQLNNNMTQYANINFDYLQQILDAILGIDIQECGCDCDQIIELLIQILTNLENGINHEGYEDEYGFINLP